MQGYLVFTWLAAADTRSWLASDSLQAQRATENRQ
jgi:hypothetical protein